MGSVEMEDDEKLRYQRAVDEQNAADNVRAIRLATDYLARSDEDWTFSDPEDIKCLSRVVLRMLANG